MCCPGCQAVSESIIAMGLSDYYHFRESLPETSPRDIETDLEQLLFYDHDKVQDKYVELNAENQRSIALMVSGIVCSACTWLIETRIGQLKGVASISVNQSTSRAKLSWDPELIQLSEILKAISDLGYQAQPYDQKIREQQLVKDKKQFLQRLAIAGLGMMQVMMYSLGFYLDLNQEMSQATWALLRWVSLLISAPVVFYAASPFYISAFKSLKNKAINMDVPVTIAIFSAWIASTYATVVGAGEVYFDSVSMFVFFLLTGRYLQMIAIHKAGRVLDERLGTRPETAIKLSGNEQQRVLLEEVNPGDKLLVKPGSQIPCDGTLIDTAAQIDESILTGESYPIRKYQAELVAAGAINVGAAFVIEVTQRVEESTLANVIRLLQQAKESKPKIQQVADKIASYFVASILVLAIATAVYWYNTAPEHVFATVLAVLVITCPCALSLATPVAITTALGRLTAWSVLVNRSSALFNLSQLTDIVFDKTGTLTTGRFVIEDFENFSNQSDEQLKSIMATLESRSEHPIATAFDEYELSAANITELSMIDGKGLQARLDGKLYQLGNAQFMTKEQMNHYHDDYLTSGTQLFLLCEQDCLARLVIDTEIRSDAQQTIDSFIKQGLKVHLLSGDKEQHVTSMGKRVGIPEHNVRGGQLPEQKLEYIKLIQIDGGRAAMIGDGLNDSPAMAAATVSIAMSQSTDITKVNADMILLTERISLVSKSYHLSAKVRRIIKQNLTWAFSYNMLGVPLAMTGYITPWIAAAGMSVSSLVVVVNALRLSRDK